MKAEIIKQAKIETIPSASGIEVINGMIYIVGDDSSALFCLDPYLNIKSRIELFNSSHINEDRIPKKHKHDLEAITTLKINGYDHLFIMGSGSKSPQRDIAYLVKLPTNYNKKHLIWKRELNEFYDFLRMNEEIVQEGKLNIEGAATGDDFVVIFNRGNKKGKNAALLFYKEEFIEFAQGHMEAIPFPKIAPFDLPEFENKPSGFSGATIFDNKLFYTASVEDTDDNYNDGEVSVSYLGVLGIKSFSGLNGMGEIPFTPQVSTCIISNNGEPYIGKVESVSIFEKSGDTSYTALAVTDNDDGFSTILMLDISL